MFDNATEAFYHEFLKPFEDYRFGLTTARITDTGWSSQTRRAGNDAQIKEWLVKADADGLDAHLSMALVPASVIRRGNKYTAKDITTSLTRCFVFDVDVHHNADKKRKASDYADAAEAENAIKDAIEAGLPIPDYVVRSGSGGLHLWYFVANYIDTPSHKRTWEAFSAALTEVFELKHDSKAGLTAKNTIRAPGSFNNKPHLQAYARCEKTGGKIRTLRSLQKAWGVSVKARAGNADELERSHREARELPEYEMYTSDVVRHACAYMVYQYQNGAKDLNRDEWLGVASVVRHLQGWAEPWKQRCLDLYGDVTEKQLDEALDPDVGLRGPISCIDMGGGDHFACNGCQIKTMGPGTGYPINWIQKVSADMASGKPPPKPPKPKEVDTEPEPEEPFEVNTPDFMIAPVATGWGVFKTKIRRGKTTPEKLIAQPAFKLKSVERRPSGAIAVFDMESKDVMVEMTNINHQNSLSKALGKVGMMVHDPVGVLRYVQQTMAGGGVHEETLGDVAGWSSDRRKFVTLTATIRDDGTESSSALESPPLNGDGVSAEGTVSQWREALNPLNEHDCRLFIFAVLCGFAAPLPALLPRTHQAPAVVSCYHPDSGRGKSTFLKLANSVFMKPLETNIGFHDTDASAFKSMGVMRHLFCSIDEMTSKIADLHFDANQFVGTFILGYERGRLSSAATQQERSGWRTILGISTNSPINESLAIDEAQGGLARVHELYFDQLPLPKYVADDLVKKLANNHGFAGPEFIRQLLLIPDTAGTVNVMYERWLGSFEGATHFDTEHRFAASLFAFCMTALELTNKFGLTQFDSASMFDYFVTELEQRVKDVKMQLQRTEVTPNQFFNSIRNDMFSPNGERLFDTINDMMRDSEHPVFVDRGRLYFTNTAFAFWCRRYNYARGILNKWAHQGYVSTDVKERSFRMLDQPMAAQKYHRMYLKKFLTDDELNEIEERLDEKA